MKNWRLSPASLINLSSLPEASPGLHFPPAMATDVTANNEVIKHLSAVKHCDVGQDGMERWDTKEEMKSKAVGSFLRLPDGWCRFSVRLQSNLVPLISNTSSSFWQNLVWFYPAAAPGLNPTTQETNNSDQLLSLKNILASFTIASLFSVFQNRINWIIKIEFIFQLCYKLFVLL